MHREGETRWREGDGWEGAGIRRMPVTSKAPSTETIERPPPGLARGLWEAPPWLFFVVAGATLAGGLVFLLVALRRRRASR